MSRNRFRRGFHSFVDLFGSAVAVAGAAHSGHQPARRDLERLGIDADQYRSIGRH